MCKANAWCDGRTLGSEPHVLHLLIKVFSCVFFFQLDLTKPIEDQGPLDVIIHKLTDVILEADQNDSQSLELVQRFQVCDSSIALPHFKQEDGLGAANSVCSLCS